MLREKIKEIADDYAYFTHRGEGWETYLSLDEYEKLRAMAIKELEAMPTQTKAPTFTEIPKVEGPKKNATNIPLQEVAKSDRVEVEEEKHTNNPEKNKIVSIDLTSTPVPKPKKSKEEMELEILMGLKED